jgi:metallo-beta-lactamase family protein
MRLRFFGAAGEVTGSCTLLETSRARVLIDFGMHQGGPHAESRNMRVPPFRARDIDAVVLTHAHIDHSGRLPMLANEDFRGRIHATPASVELCDILLRDSAHIQQADAERLNRKRRPRGRSRAAAALYGASEVERVMQQFTATGYGEAIGVAPGVTITYHDAGHILGSAWVELTAEDTDASGRPVTRRVVFSGDIGPYDAPLLRDPTPPPACDALILESTYGDRDHKDLGATIEELAQILRSAHTPKGKVLIPSFAVGRTQQLIYFIGGLLRDGKLERTRAYIDSPMATEATTLYRRHRELFDDDAWKLINSGESCLHFDGLKFTRTPDESRAINAMGNGVIVISASGMCTGGRILHHLRHGLPREETHVVFVGYQGEGTLGRRIVDREPRVRVMGEPVDVRATIHTLGGFSAHAGQSDLVRWATPALESGPRLILNHGEDRQRAALAGVIKGRFGVDAALPWFKDIVEL